MLSGGQGHSVTAAPGAAAAIQRPPMLDAFAPATGAQPLEGGAHSPKPAARNAPSTQPTDTEFSPTKGSNSPQHSVLTSVAPAHADAFARMPTLLLVRLAAAAATLAHYGPQVGRAYRGSIMYRQGIQGKHQV
eukprot:1152247-Pelagomonas_calceolata.AAC.1